MDRCTVAIVHLSPDPEPACIAVPGLGICCHPISASQKRAGTGSLAQLPLQKRRVSSRANNGHEAPIQLNTHSGERLGRSGGENFLLGCYRWPFVVVQREGAHQS